MEEQENRWGDSPFECPDKAGMFLCTQGMAEVLLNSRKYRLQRGMLCIISPLVTWYVVSRSDDFGGVSILDDLSVFYAVIRANVDTLVRLRVRNNPCIRLDEADMAFILERHELLDRKRRQLSLSSSDEEKSLIRQMLQLLEQEAMLEIISVYLRMRAVVEAKPLEKNESVVYSFIYSLHLHFKTERSVAFYAAEAHLSTNYFTTLIRQTTELTPSEWIVAITTSHAKLQLTKTQKSIKEIAEELNFPEQFTFRKYFKQYVGMPPKEYRQQFQQQK